MGDTSWYIYAARARHFSELCSENPAANDAYSAQIPISTGNRWWRVFEGRAKHAKAAKGKNDFISGRIPKLHPALA